MSKKLVEILETFSKEILISIIEDMANDYSGLEERLLFRYVQLDEDGEIKKNKKYISDITKKYCGGRRFVTWRECTEYSMEVREVLAYAKDYYFDTKKPLVAIETALSAITKARSALNYMDDSNGDVGEIIDESMRLLDEVCINEDEFELSDKMKVFTKLLKEADKSTYDGWEEWRIEVISNCIYFCDNEKLRKKFEATLDQLLNRYSDSSSYQYYESKILLLKLKLIEDYGTDEEEQQFIEENIKYYEIREILINKHIKNNEFEKVLTVAKDGEVADSEYRGSVYTWQKYKYLAYKNLGMINDQKELALNLFFKENKEFYSELKDLYKDQWDTFYLKIKNELKTKRHTIGFYAFIVIEENDLEELLQLTQSHIEYIEQYAELLIEKYSDEASNIYRDYINQCAGCASDRKLYKKVCKKIKVYKQLFGDIEAFKIVKELQNKYGKKPAFVDELLKI